MLSKFSEISFEKSIALIVFGMLAVILSALAFEHIGGYIPCKLCLEQREPWYAGIPVGFFALVGALMKWPRLIVRMMMTIVLLLLIYSVVLGVRHAGVEWAWWEGPGDCGVVSSDLSISVNELASGLKTESAPSCTDAALRVLGLSFAGWNAVISAILAIFTGFTLLKKST